MLTDVAGQRLHQLADLGPHPGLRQASRRVGVAFAVDQRGEHRPPGHPEDVGGHRRQLDPGVSLAHLIPGQAYTAGGTRAQATQAPGRPLDVRATRTVHHGRRTRQTTGRLVVRDRKLVFVYADGGIEIALDKIYEAKPGFGHISLSTSVRNVGTFRVRDVRGVAEAIMRAKQAA